MSYFEEGEMDASKVPADGVSGMPEFETNGWPCFKEDSIFETTVIEAAKSVEVSLEMVRTSALGVMATACQGLVDVEFPNGAKAPTSLMCLIISESGERKTSLDKWLSQPLLEFQAQKELEARSQKQAYARLHKNWMVKTKALEKALAKAFIKEDENEKANSIEEKLIALQFEEPSLPRGIKIHYENATPSALAYNLHENVPIACLISNEAGTLLNGPTFRDMPLFNSLWSGGSFPINRSSLPSFTLNQPRLTTSLMLQQVAIERFLDKRGDEAHGNGFLSRFLVIKPREMAGKRTNIMPPVPEDVKARFYNRVKELIARSIEMHVSDQERRILKFSAKAKKLWAQQSHSIENQMNQGGIYYHAKGHASKLMDNISRVAGVIHTFEGYEGDISSGTLEYAYRLCCKYSQHYLEQVSKEPEVVKITNLLVQDIRKLATPYFEGYKFTKSLIQQKGSPKLRKIKARKLALETLEKLGHLQPPVNYGGEYEFRDTVWTTWDPEVKNGEEYSISELPLWRDQVLVNQDSRGRYLPKFTIKSNDARHY